MRKISFSEALPHILVCITVVTLLVIFLLNAFPRLKEPEFIDGSSAYSESSAASAETNDFSNRSVRSVEESGIFSESGGSAASSEPQSGLININTATVSELMALDGIGEVKAKAIVEYREANGYFKSVDDLMLVKGIGEKTLEKNRDRITV